MRIAPDRQTLILAGEPLPRRTDASDSAGVLPARSGSSRVTIISARLDAVVTESDYTPSSQVPDSPVIPYAPSASRDVGAGTALPTLASRSSALTSRAYSSFAGTNRGGSFGAANAYARTQDLSERHPIIDTYA